MSDFLKVLGAGVAIIAVALLLSGSSVFEGPKETANYTVFKSANIGQIGSVQETYRHISLGTFTVGQSLGNETVKEVKEMAILNGWFTEHSESIIFPGNGARAAYIVFRVEDTNRYGNLQIYFNKRQIYNDVPKPGIYRVDIASPESENTLEIKAVSSGVKFWAPTTYILKDLSVIESRYLNQDYELPFTVFDYEATGWSLGRLTFGIDDAILAGDLVGTINGQEIYRDRPISKSLQYQKDFTTKDAQIHVGENTLVLKTEKDGKYHLSNAELTLFFYAGGQSVSKTFTFDADPAYIGLLKTGNATGAIAFTVDRVYLDSGITVYLNNKPLELSVAPAGRNEVYFTSKDLREDKNEIKFSTRGSYILSDLAVQVRLLKEAKN